MAGSKGRARGVNVGLIGAGRIGAGHLDFSSMLGSLCRSGCIWYVSGEFLSYPDASVSAGRCIEYPKHCEELLNRLSG